MVSLNRDDPRVHEYVRKTWNEYPELSYGQLSQRVNREFGLCMTRDAFKNWSRRRRLKPGISEVPVQDSAEELEEAKAKLVEHVERRKQRADLTRRAAVDLIVDAFREIAPTMPPLPAPKVLVLPTGQYADEEAILTISDLHGGETLEEEETGGLGSFDWDSVMVYAARLLTKLKSIVPRHNYRIPVLHLHFLGDILTGLDIYPGQWNYVAFEEVEQVLRCLELLTWFLLELLTVYPRIIVKCVYGNHGRIGKKGERRLYNNWDFLLYKLLEMRIQSCPEAAARIEFVIPKTWWLLTEIKGWHYLLMHGDDVRGWAGFPHYGVARLARNWTMLLQHMGASKRLLGVVRDLGSFDELEFGHHHMTYYTDDTGLNIWANAAWPGGSLLSLKKLGRKSRPAQNYRGVSDAASTSWYYKLNLDTDLEEEMSVEVDQRPAC